MKKTKEQIIPELIEELIRVTNKMRTLEKGARDFGTGEPLHTFGIHIIDAIGRGVGRTATELARLFSVTNGAISQEVGKLHRAGYVEKARNPEYGKEIILSLTEKGQVAMAGHEEFHRFYNREMIEGLHDVNEANLLEFKAMLVRVGRQLERSIALADKKSSFNPV